jgi:transposase-like protein
MHLPAHQKLVIVKAALAKKKSVSCLAAEHKVARKTIYAWIARYEQELKEGRVSLSNRYVRSFDHPRYIKNTLEESVLRIASLKPDLTIREISELVPGSLSTIWQILAENTNTTWRQSAEAVSKRPMGRVGEQAGGKKATFQIIYFSQKAQIGYRYQKLQKATFRVDPVRSLQSFQKDAASLARTMREAPFVIEVRGRLGTSGSPLGYSFVRVGMVGLVLVIGIPLSLQAAGYRILPFELPIGEGRSLQQSRAPPTVRLASVGPNFADAQFTITTSSYTVAGATGFNSTQQPQFLLVQNTPDTGVMAAATRVLGLTSQGLPEGVAVKVTDSQGKAVGRVEAALNEAGVIELALATDYPLEAGNYQIVLTDENTGETATQDFSWGVLAVNTNKSIFTPRETAYLALAVLDPNGDMVCDAQLEMVISSAEGEGEILSTDNGRIWPNPECEMHSITSRPDYAATYITREPGDYQMVLKATTESGVYTIQDRFLVREEVAFDVERLTGTRIYPLAEYPVVLTIVPSEDYTGVVTDRAPAEFGIRDMSEQEIGEVYDWLEVDVGKGIVTGLSTELKGGVRELTWEVEWQAGETYYLTYGFDAPNVSPDYYVLGPLTIGEFSESRQWQLAIDSVPSGIIIAWPGTAGNIPAGWSRVTGLDSFYVKGTASDPSGLAGGAETHSHTSPPHSHSTSHTHTGTTSAGSGSVTSQALSELLVEAHTHDITTDAAGGNNNPASANLDEASNHPPFVEVVWIQSNGTSDIPSGAWVYYNSDSLPSGFSRQAGNRFLKGAEPSGNGGGTGGSSNNHTHSDLGHSHTQNPHTHTGTTEASGDTGGRSQTGSTAATADHVHTISGGETTATEQADSSSVVTAGNAEPPFYKLNIIQNDGAATSPDFIIAMWTGSLANVPPGWEVCNGIGNCPDLDDRFIKGANTNGELGTIGGSLSHSHGAAETHTHVIDSHTHNFTVGAASATTGPRTGGQTTGSATADHSHTLSVTGGGVTGTASITADTSTTETRPPFKEVVFIQKQSSAEFSGTVLQAGAAYGNCDGSTPMVKAYIGGQSYSAPCQPGTGNFTISPSGDPSASGMVFWLAGQTEKAAVAFEYDGSGQVTGLNLHTGRVSAVTQGTPVSLATLAVQTSANDSDIPYTISGSTATLYTNIDLSTALRAGQSSGTTILELEGAVVTQGSGSLLVGDDTKADLTANGSVIAGGVTVADGATLEINGDTTVAGNVAITGSGTISYSFGNTPTLTVEGPAKLGDESGTATGNLEFYNLALTGAASMTTLESDLDDVILVTNNVTVGDGHTLAMNNKTLDVNGGRVETVGSGSISCQNCVGGGLLLSGDGSSNGLGGGTGAIELYSLTLDGPAFTTAIGSADVTILTDLTIGSDRILSAYSGTLTLLGDLINLGTFVPNSGTVALAALEQTSQTITGSTSFYNLNFSSQKNRVLRIGAGDTVGIVSGGTLAATGSSCSGMAVFRSTVPGSEYFLNNQGAVSLTYADVEDMTASGNQTILDNSVNSGHNSGLSFGPSACLGVSETEEATAQSFQRKTFYDAVHNNWWTFFGDGREIEVRYSATGTGFESDEPLPFASSDFSVFNKVILGTHYVWLAVADDDSINIIKGEVGASGISWEVTVQTALAGLAGSLSYSRPVISADSSNRLWVGARRYGDGSYGYTSARSNEVGTADFATITWMGPEHIGGLEASETVLGAMVTLADEVMMASVVLGTRLRSYLWNPTEGSWETDPEMVTGGPAGTVGTSDLVGATGGSPERKTFFDQANSTYWAFFQNGTEIEYAGSTDGLSWSSVGTLSYGTSSFTVNYQRINETSYVYLTTECDSFDICLHRGTLGSQSLSFEEAITVFDGTSETNNYLKPAITVDSNNYIWVAAKENDEAGNSSMQVVVKRSTNTATQVLSAWQSQTVLGVKSGDLSDLALLPQTAGEVILLAGSNSAELSSWQFNGSSWNSGEGNGGYRLETYGQTFNGPVWSVVKKDNDLYIGGGFTTVNSTTVNNLVRYNLIDQTYYPLGEGAIKGVDGQVQVMVVDDTDIYIGGLFLNCYNTSTLACTRLTRYSTLDNTFYSMGGGSAPGVDGQVRSMGVVGTDVYIGGQFQNCLGSANINCNRMVRYSMLDDTYYIVGQGSTNGLSATVLAMAVSGTDIYIGGTFPTCYNQSDLSCNRVARYSTTENLFYALGSGATKGVNEMVYSLALSGTDLYIGGGFTVCYNSSDLACERLARYSITDNTFYALGEGATKGVDQNVRSMVAIGTDVFIGGDFTTCRNSTDLVCNKAARYSMTDNTFYALGEGATTGVDGTVRGISLVESDVYIGGDFTSAEGTTSNNLAKYWPAERVGVVETFSAAADAAGNVHLAYTTETGALEYRYLEEQTGNWSQEVSLTSGLVAEVTLGLSADGGLVHSYYRHGSNTYHKQAATPFGETEWDTAATVVQRGVLSGLAVAETVPATEWLVYTRPADTGYTVRFAQTGVIGYIGSISSLIDNVPAAETSATSPQRLTFYDEENGSYWVFYHNGTEIEYASSSSGSSWTNRGTLAHNTGNFSLSYQVINSVGYVFLATECDDYDICLLRGTLGAGSVSFDSPVTVYDGTSATDNYLKPAITVDSNNYVWVAAKRNDGIGNSSLKAVVKRSDNVATQALSGWQAHTALGVKDSGLGDLALVAQGGGRVLLLTGSNSENLMSWQFDGSSWASVGGDGDYGFLTFEQTPFNGTVNVITKTITDLYIGGEFTVVEKNSANRVEASGIVRYNLAEQRFYALGAGATKGVGGSVSAIAVDGTNIYIGGTFTTCYNTSDLACNYVVRYSTLDDTFYSLGEGATKGLNAAVAAIAVTGTDVYIGGQFTICRNTSDLACNRIVRYSTSDNIFYPLGEGATKGLNQQVLAVAVAGTDVYIGGQFTICYNSSDLTCNRIVRYSPADNTYYPLGAGTTKGVANTVWVLAVDDTDVYLGGTFTTCYNSSDLTCNRIARYSTLDNTFYTLGQGATQGVSGTVRALAINGTDIYLGGVFQTCFNSSNLACNRVARYSTSNSTFYAMAAGVDNWVYGIAVAGTDVYIGGSFNSCTNSTDLICNFMARYSTLDNTLYALGPGATQGVNGLVRSIAISGTDVYIGGVFSTCHNSSILLCYNVVRYSTLDNTFYPLGAGSTKGVDGGVSAIAITGTDVYIGGQFTICRNLSDLTCNRIVRYSTADNIFYPLGEGTTKGVNNAVNSIDITGTDVYIGGQFITCYNTTDLACNQITRYSTLDNIFYALGEGATKGVNAIVSAVVVSGSDVYIGGQFTICRNVSDLTCNRIVRYSPADNIFYPLGEGATKGVNGAVRSLAASGTDVYIGGAFATCYNTSNLTCNRIVRYSTADNIFYPLGEGATKGVDGIVWAIAISGTDVYLGGEFTTCYNSSNLACNRLARYSTLDNTFRAMGAGDRVGASHTVNVISAEEQEVWAGGDFTSIEGRSSNYIAQYVPVVAAGVGEENTLSVAADEVGNVYLAYTNLVKALKFRQLSSLGDSWSEAEEIDNLNSEVDEVTLGVDGAGSRIEVYFRVEGLGINYVVGEINGSSVDWVKVAYFIQDLNNYIGITGPERYSGEESWFVYGKIEGEIANIRVTGLTSLDSEDEGGEPGNGEGNYIEVWARSFSTVSNSADTVYLLYADDELLGQPRMRTWSAVGGWSEAEPVSASTNVAEISLSRDNVSGDLYAFLMNEAQDTILSRQYLSLSQSWQTEEEVATGGSYGGLTTTYEGEGHILGLWTQGEASPYSANYQVVLESVGDNSPPEAPGTPFVHNSDAQLGWPSPVSKLTAAQPVFSAVYTDSNASDTAPFYQIQVGTNTDWSAAEMWDSGKIAMTSCSQGSRCQNISYNGSVLAAGSTYFWRIRFWDNHDATGQWSANQEFSMNALPIISNVEVNGGLAINLTEGTTTSVSFTATVTDTDGYSDIQSVSGRLFRSGVAGGAECSPNSANCYSAPTCSLSSCSGSSCTATCTVEVEFFADATSTGTYSSEYWRGYIEASDQQNASGSGLSSSTATDVNALYGLSLSGTIAYGPLGAGQDSGSSPTALTITNTGNVTIDTEVSGDNMCTDYPTCSGEQIQVGQQEFGIDSFSYGAGTLLSSSPIQAAVAIPKATASPSNATGSLYFGIGIPFNQPMGTYAGQNTITAVGSY